MTWRVEYVDETGSTNDDLIAAATAGAPDRSVLITGHQTAGRGRMDRRWDAPPGSNLLMSVLFRRVPDVPAELTHRIGVAILDGARSALRSTDGRPADASEFASRSGFGPDAGAGAGPDAGAGSLSGSRPGSAFRQLSLKWPNDALLDGRKLAGVLAQMAVMPSGEPFVVVGFGVNVGWCPPDAARLGELAPGLGPRSLAEEVLAAFDRLPVDSRLFHERYRSELATLGQRVRVELPGDAPDVIGVAVDVDRTGRLVVEPDTLRGDVVAGERMHRSEAGSDVASGGAEADDLGTERHVARRSFDTADIVHLRRVD